MRSKNSFTVYPRTLPGGKVVWYYQTYDADGRRLAGRSTGKATKTAAKAYCEQLMREGLLGTGEENKRFPLFKDYAKGWWVFETCDYMQEKAMNGSPITLSSAAEYNRKMKRYVLPKFGNRRIDRINEEEIRLWRLDLVKEGYKRSTIKTTVAVLSIMLEHAMRNKHLIKYNPCRLLPAWTKDEAVPDILSPQEIRALFPDEWSEVWDDYVAYVICKTAAHTGLRFGELLGITGDHVF